MQDRPTRTELLEALEDFLRLDLLPELGGASAFHVRVAANVTAIVRRELELAPAARVDELGRLEGLLGRTGDLAGLNAELCRQLRANEIALDSAPLVEHLVATTLAKVEIDNPRYASLAEAKARWPSGGIAADSSIGDRGDHEST